MTAGSARAQSELPEPALTSLTVTDSRLTFGERAGASVLAPASAVGQKMALEFRAEGSAAPWRPLATRLIRSGGRVKLRAKIDRSGAVRITIPGTTGDAGMISREAPVRVRARVEVRRRTLQVTAGRRVAASGHVRPGSAGLPVALQILRAGRWVTLDSGRTGPGGRYSLADRRPGTMSARARIRLSGASVGLRAASRSLGRLDVYRQASASWYGPGLYGNRLGCGGRLSAGSLGVAHKHLPCGTLVTFRRSGRSVRVPVIDRGPYVGGREFDLTAATARRLGFRGHGPILATR